MKMNRISELFSGKTVFISGGTGFLGKLLIEKLLRCSPKIKKIYVLIRDKKGVAAQKRLEAIFENPVYDLLKQQRPGAIAKCVAIPGDVSEIDLGVSEDLRKILTEEVDFIFHSAATTRFDESYKNSVIINTRGTKYMLELGLQCKHLILFVHVSTAFSHYYAEVIEEKFYNLPKNLHTILERCDLMNNDEFEKEAKLFFSDIPNSYTFSKMLAEALVKEQLGKMPLLVVRPCLVSSILRDPYPGWVNNLQGAMGLFVAAGKGILRSMYMRKDVHIPILPADIVTNAILASSWGYLENICGKVINIHAPKDEISYTWEEVVNVGTEILSKKKPFNIFVWYPGGTMTTNKVVHYINVALFQIIPAIFVDIFLFVLGYDPILLKTQLRIYKSSGLLSFYTTKEWEIEVKEVIKVRERMNQAEKEIYNLDKDGFELEKYLIDGLTSVKKNILKESDKYEKTALRVLNVLYYVDKLIKWTFILMVCYVTYKFFLV